MIKVTCGACGAAFTAKPELAGRHGKCPSCKAPIVVPDLEVGNDSTPAVSVRKTSTKRRSTSSTRRPHGRKSTKSSPFNLAIIIGFVSAVGAVGAWFAMQEGSGPGPYTAGLDFLAQGQYEEAIAEFDKVGPEDRLYAQAMEQRASAEERRAAGLAVVATQKSENTYQIIIAIEKHQVDRDGQGHFDPNYAPHTRYMLKRCAQFKKEFPNSSHIEEIDAIMWRYEDVASLDTPPTEADTRAEINLRLIMQNPNYKDSMLAVDEFATAWPDQVVVAKELRNEIEAHSREYWRLMRADLQQYLQPGQENWRQVANDLATYLKKIEEADGLVASIEARELYKKATDG